MERLTIINFINPGWFRQIISFLDENPTFHKLLPIVALDEFPSGFNKNPHETDPDAPRNIFETIIYGLALANVDIDYGKSQYVQMVNYLRDINVFTENMEFPFDVEEKKVRTYQELINTLLENNIIITEMKFEELPVVENVWGMTESTITLLHLLYNEVESDRCLPYNDKQFKRGMQMFYELEDTSEDKLKEICSKWTNKKVGLMFVVQYAHYSEFV
uniref:Uncharacterized protein n=1 Tax=viral metagenome TaxID=1070528 RepID=A0A6C0KQ30_9ZZZZ